MKPLFQDIHPSRNSVKKNQNIFNVVLLNFCIYLFIVNKMLVAPSVCDVESFCTSQIIYIFKTKHHKISIAWLKIFFTLFKFI